jgi:hypothetical protein
MAKELEFRGTKVAEQLEVPKNDWFSICPMPIKGHVAFFKSNGDCLFYIYGNCYKVQKRTWERMQREVKENE